jgi:putative endonuclease
MGDGRAELGLAGEAAALEHYVARGFRLVARNWRCSVGEIDLIVERGLVLVFCEVKTRRGVALGGGYEAVTFVKQRKLRQLAELFLLAHRTADGSVRFDVASVSVGPRGRPSVELFEDAF